jgi:arginyl-tRNA synthetase
MQILIDHIGLTLEKLYGIVSRDHIVLNDIPQEFEGDLALVVFPFTKISKKNPTETAQEIGIYLKSSCSFIDSFIVEKGFLNIKLTNDFWIKTFNTYVQNNQLGILKPTGKRILVEYSSPNTNKPLHLGHVRNNVLGYSVANILKAAGNTVFKVNLVNDRGIHICKSMLAWQLWGNGDTPTNSNLKGDHLVGKYYVMFEQHNKQQTQQVLDSLLDRKFEIILNINIRVKAEQIVDNYNNETDLIKKNKILNDLSEIAKTNTPLYNQSLIMLQQWENNDKEVVALWQMMNQWVYDGFSITYKNLGVDFDKTYFESQVYQFGKEVVNEGLQKNIFYKKDNGAVAIDLTKEGLDEKIVLRPDGTSVYITQDIGVAQLKFDDFAIDQSIYVVGNEQDYHFKVLKAICEKLNMPFAKGIFHLSYGMVELPNGKMKSREGTVVDADDLIKSMIDTARENAIAHGKIDQFNDTEQNELFELIGLGALKYFLLKVDPKKKILFNPAESIDFHGNTAPFIQYAYARIQSILNKGEQMQVLANSNLNENILLSKIELELLQVLLKYNKVILDAARMLSPSEIVQYVYTITKLFNQFYAELPILKADTDIIKNRLLIAKICGHTIKHSMNLLGINVPQKM